MIATTDLIFYILSFICIFSAASLVIVPNPIYSALCLVVTMIAAAFLYMGLDSYFLAAVQLIVYAGAVTVLFLMVVMLFDLKHEMQSFSKGRIGLLVRLSVVSVFLGHLFVGFRVGFSAIGPNPPLSPQYVGLREIAGALFGKYVFGFEAISILLLIVIVGVVAMSRSRGGTHA